jgi:plasmid stability protein
MSTNITIKGIPDDIYQLLKTKAELNHRSINSEVIVTLTKALTSKRTETETLLERTSVFKSKSKGMIAMDEIVDYIDKERL